MKVPPPNPIAMICAMNRTHLALGITSLLGMFLQLASAQSPAKPPLAAVQPVTDDYFGIKIVDPYRYMENFDDPQVAKWMKAQADYTRSVLDKIPGRADLLAEIEKYVNAPPAAVHDVSRLVSGRYFFTKTLSSEKIAKLYMRDTLSGSDVLLV